MLSVDVNCDMGEGAGNDALLMPFISSANIACGYHAGDEKTMQQTIELAIQHNVAVGAHPSFDDKENFGRTETDLEPAAIYELVSRQLFLLDSIAKSKGAVLHHVKPHGALYNMSAKNETIAAVIAKAVFDYNPRLILYGLSGSVSITVAIQTGLQTANEVFADRTYQDDGSLTSRKLPGALIEDKALSLQQVVKMITGNGVIALSGKKIPIQADTICIHGDGPYAPEFAKMIHDALIQKNIIIKPIAS